MGLFSLHTLANTFVNAIFIVKSSLCELGMPCALEKIVLVELSKDVVSFSSTTKKIISPLPQCL